MSEAIPQHSDAHYSDNGPVALAHGPPPVLSNNRIAGRCRVIDCPADLFTQTNTNRKYYLCRDHWAAERIIVDDVPQRFCGQCSRFKILSEYDGPKRTCRQCLFLRNTKKRNQRHENQHRGAYRSPLPPYQYDSNGNFSAPAAPSSMPPPPVGALPGFGGGGGGGDNGGGPFYSQQHNLSQMQQTMQQQLQFLQGQPQGHTPHQLQPPPPRADAVGSIDIENLNTILSLVSAMGVIGDGNTGNSEADALYYLFQELKTMKDEIETKGVTVAAMHAKKRKLHAEQELARANLEVADIEEQLIRVSMLNKANRKQLEQEQRQSLKFLAGKNHNEKIEADEATAAAVVAAAALNGNNNNFHIHTTSTIPITTITTTTTTTTAPSHNNENNNITITNTLLNKRDAQKLEIHVVSSETKEEISPVAPTLETEPKLTRRSSSGE